MNDSEKQYSAFWPVFLVFLCFTITHLLNLWANVRAFTSLNAELVQLKQNAAQAQAKEAALTGLAHDLIDLAPSSLVAQQIVTDFHIQMRGQSNRAPGAAAVPSNQPSSSATGPKQP